MAEGEIGIINSEEDYRLSKNHWRQVIKKQSPNSRRKANYRHQRSTKTQGLKVASQYHCNNQDAKHENRISASLQYQEAEPKARISREA